MLWNNFKTSSEWQKHIYTPAAWRTAMSQLLSRNVKPLRKMQVERMFFCDLNCSTFQNLFVLIATMSASPDQV